MTKGKNYAIFPNLKQTFKMKILQKSMWTLKKRRWPAVIKRIKRFLFVPKSLRIKNLIKKNNKQYIWYMYVKLLRVYMFELFCKYKKKQQQMIRIMNNI